MKSKTPINIEYIQKLLEPLYSKYTFVKAFIQEQSGLIVLADSKQSQAKGVPYLKGIVISIFHNGVNSEMSTSFQRESELRHIINEFEQSLHLYKNNTVTKLNLQEESETLTKHFQSQKGETIALSEKIHIAQTVVKQIHSLEPSINLAQVQYKETTINEHYLSKNKKLSQELHRFEAIFVAVLSSDQGHSAQIYDGYGYQGGWEKATPSKELLLNMVNDGKKILNAKRLEPGFYDCIFSPSLAGILAHEAFGHGTEADTILKGRAKGEKYFNKAVASEKVNLYDSPALPNVAASYFFDHEGELQSTTKIVEKGILKNPITDHYSASLLNVKRTANGRRQAYDHKTYTRMTNTYFVEGEDHVDKMFDSVEEGYFINRATNGMEDPKGWGIQLEALYAEKIKNGKLTGEVFSPVIITGYVPDILTSISMVSNKMEINGLGMCGKGHKEWVKVTDGGPYLKLKARLS